eukprot:82097_1
MLIFLAVALLLLFFLWWNHYRRHFRWHCSKCSKTAPERFISPSNDNQQMNFVTNAKETISGFMLSPIDGEEFDFFPVSFLLFLTLLILLHIVLITLCILDNESFKPSKLSIDEFRILDYVLMYSMVIVSVWVSLFSFHRYLTTLISTKRISAVPSYKGSVHIFSLYTVIFVALYLIQIHFYYWSFPLVIVLFFVFNIYCSYHASAMLIEQYKRFLEHIDSQLHDVTINMNHNMLNRRIAFTKYVSLACCLLYTMDLSVFLIVYNHYPMDIIRYLSMSWRISSFMFSLHFIRNVGRWKRILLRLKAQTKVQSNRNEIERVATHQTSDLYHAFDVELMSKSVHGTDLIYLKPKAFEVLGIITTKDTGSRRENMNRFPRLKTLMRELSTITRLSSLSLCDDDVGNEDEDGLDVPLYLDEGKNITFDIPISISDADEKQSLSVDDF